MTPEQRAQLREIVNEGNLGRIFKDIDDLGRRLDMFAEAYQRRSQEVEHGALPTPRVSLDRVLAEFRSNPYRVEVLLQAPGDCVHVHARDACDGLDVGARLHHPEADPRL